MISYCYGDATSRRLPPKTHPDQAAVDALENHVACAASASLVDALRTAKFGKTHSVSLVDDFAEVGRPVFGRDEKRRLMDMRRTDAVEASAGGASVESIAAKMGNRIDQNKTLQRTYMPVNSAAVRAADESRKIGRRKLGSEQNEFKKLKLASGKS
ncbi:MAG: hypothetical protein EOS78_10185 [Mesorhizobium sp.]|nr:MAG: hypothetical protein EOS78_10185 [Mesorhizobium sp.]